MTTIEQALFDAVLADIVYVDGLTPGLTGLNLEDVIKSRIYNPLAEMIGARFEVLAVKNDLSSGYQGVVFRDKTTNELYLANRGTESLNDFLADGDLAVMTGVASSQTASMVNWWLQISNPAGTTVTQVTPGIIDQFTNASSVLATGEIAAALAESGGKVCVVGHSLGGHLTTIFSSLFSSQVSRSSTFNGAGLFSIGTQLSPVNWFINFLSGEPLNQLAGLIGSTVLLPESKQDNFYAYNGLNVTTNSLTFTQIGERIRIFNEYSNVLIYENHFMYKLTDALALMSVIEKLDPTVTLSSLNVMLEGASSTSGTSLEGMLDALRKPFGYIDTTPNNNRELFYSNLYALQNDSYFNALQGKIKIELATTTSLSSLAKNQFSAMVSLVTLSPVMLSGIDQTSQAMLDARLRLTWGEMYDQWIADQSLTTAQRAAGQANFSDQYLSDRAGMMTGIVLGNQGDNRDPNGGILLIDTDGSDNFIATDAASGQRVSLVNTALLSPSIRQIYFGDARGNGFTGGSSIDNLYGGAGNDTLIGGDGNDYIEGNQDDDKLIGGKGDDVLYGGTGDDIYVYNIGDGHDTIVDSDNKGRIFIHQDGDFILTRNLYHSSTNNVWTDATGKVQITHNSPWRLVFEDGGVIELGENFQDGDFGIHLTDSPTTTLTTNTIVGDLAPNDFDSTKDGVQMQLDALGNVICSNDPMAGRSDYLYDSSDNDRIEGGDGNDFIYQGQGDDWVLGGNGRDGIGSKIGEVSGNDIIEGGLGADVLYGADGNDQIFGENKGEMSDLIAAGEIAIGINEQGDLIGGGDGNDFVYGTERNDALFGGTGQDLIVGGGGNDFISSAGDFDGTFLHWEQDNGTYVYESGPIFDWTYITAINGTTYEPVFTNLTYFNTGENDSSDDVVYAGNGNDFVFTAGGNDEVNAGDGDDVVFGWGGNDSISGDDGNDVLVGDNDVSALSIDNHGNDYIDGGNGNDVIFGNGGNDDLFGGTGDDQMQGNEGDDYLDGESGADSLWGGGGIDQIMGGDGVDYLQGDAGDDYLDGESGDDTLFGNDGNDQLMGGDGLDQISGDAGDDYLDGEAGNDSLWGGDDNDQLMGGDGNDQLQGNSGDDYLDGEADNDTLWGGDGNDSLLGGDGDDWLQGDAGDDQLDGGGGNDILRGGAGIDQINGGDGDDDLYGIGGNDVLVGGTGDDSYVFCLGDGVDTIEDYGSGIDNSLYFGAGITKNDLSFIWETDSLRINVGTGGDAIILENCTPNDPDAILPIYSVIFSDDTQYSLINLLYPGVTVTGTSGDDTIIGTLGCDIIYGDFGNDTLDGGGGPDTLDGGIGNDILIGGSGADKIFGEEGNDTLDGGDGNDTINGYDGDDVLGGGSGDDTLSGGAGIDTYLFNQGDGTDTIIESRNDMDTLRFGTGIAASDITLSRVGDDLILDINGSSDQVRIQSWGSSGVYQGWWGNFYQDVSQIERVEFAGDMVWDSAYIQSLLENLPIIGTDGNDELHSWQVGHDTVLQGFGGDDTLSALAHIDNNGYIWYVSDEYEYNSSSTHITMDGGSGNDTLKGYAGNDTYIFNLGGGQDIIDECSYSIRTDWQIYYFGGGYDTLNFGAGIAPSDISLTRNGYDLILRINGTSDQVTIRGWGNNQGFDESIVDSRIDQVMFVDTAVWNAEYIWSQLASPIVGTNGNDALYAWSLENATLQGFAGDDILYGNKGNDTYIFNRGDGQDKIIEVGGNLDILRFGAGIAPGDITLSLEGYYYSRYDLIVGINGSGDQVRIQDWLNRDSCRIERIEFAGDAVWDTAYIQTLVAGLPILGTNEHDYLYVWEEHNTLQGLGGGDELSGGDGNDTLVGGLGADTIYGGYGDDTYVFNLGDGQDRIHEGGGLDTIRFGEGIAPGDISFCRNLYDVILKINGTSDEVRIQDWGDESSSRIERVEFFGGMTWDAAYIQSRIAALPLVGTNGDDTLQAWPDENATLQGLAGNDSLYGNSGNDTYVFNLGDGQDRIYDWGGLDTIRFGEGIAPGDISFSRYWQDLILSINGTSDQVRIQNWVDESSRRIERVEFFGDTVWDAAYIQSRIAALLVATNGDDILVAWADENYTLQGLAGNDSLHGNNGNDILIGGEGDDDLAGDTGNDTYVFNLGDGQDSLYESEGNLDTICFGNGISTNDVTFSRSGSDLILSINGTNDQIKIVGWAANSTSQIERVEFSGGAVWDAAYIKTRVEVLPFVGTDDRDCLYASSGENNTLLGLAGDDGLYGNSGNDTLVGGEGDDDLAGSTGNDTLDGGTGDDIYIFNRGDGQDTINSFDTLTATDSLWFGDGILESDVRVLRSDNNLVFKIKDSTDQVVITDYYETGANGNDHKIDRIKFASGIIWDSAKIEMMQELTLNGTAGADTLTGGAGNDTLSGLAGNDLLVGNDGNDNLDGGVGNDTMLGGQGDDIYVVDSASDVVTENMYEGIDTVQSTVTYTLGANVENLTLAGTTAINGTGNTLDNILTGNSAINTLTGGAGNDTLDGGAGADRLIGGDGDDFYIVDNTADVITENAYAGFDEVQSSVTLTLAANVEKLTLTGTSAINGTGNASLNHIYGNSANNTLDGGLGADRLLGGDGNDIYIVDNTEDVITENVNEGTDTVKSSETHTLAANVENLTLTGTTAISGTGNTLDNILTGNSAINTLTGGDGNDTLDGGAGADKLLGGAGDDIYIVDNTADVITENANEGVDTVNSGITYTLGNNVENLTLTGSAAINGTGNELNNVMTGNSAINTLTGGAGDDTLNGGAGADKLFGGTGNDTYVVDNTGDVVTEFANEGIDTVISWVTYTLGNNVENLNLYGMAAINGTGNALNNVLVGNYGNNLLDGGIGNDVYLFGRGSGQDVIIDVDATVGNIDTVMIAIDVLPTDVTVTRDLSNLYLSINGTTDKVTLANWFTSDNEKVERVEFNDGPAWDVSALIMMTSTPTATTDFLVGTAVLDSIDGLEGDDIIYGGDGNDLLMGNQGDDVLYGEGGNDKLYGDEGSDILIGGLGDDRYYWIDSSDTIIENPDEGTDIVMLDGSMSYFALSANFEQLNASIAEGNVTLIGNELSNVLYGGSYDDYLDGGFGADTMVGSNGSDVYIVDNPGDIVVEQAKYYGVDTIKTFLNYTLPANVENLTLTGEEAVNGTGNSGNNYIDGNSATNILMGLAGDDRLCGSEGADILIGGTGNDTYYIDSIDTIIENPGEGVDTVVIDEFITSYTLGSNLENLEATYLKGDVTLIGNELSNLLVGSYYNDRLDGGAGADTMQGYQGSDVYIVDNVDDKVIELRKYTGVDRVEASVNYTLPDYVEDLTLSGVEAINGTGNAQNNTIIGNNASNILDGAGGNDSLDGGTGNDTYVLARGYGLDTIIENDSTAGNTDVAQFNAEIAADQLWFQHFGNNLEVSILGTNDKFNLQNWYSGSQYHVEQFKSGDGKVLLDTQVDALVSAMAAFAPPAVGQTVLPQNYQTALAPVIAANWH